MPRPTLIFPAGMPRALDYLGQCLAEGRDVIGASSLAYDTAREKYPSWIQLPYVTESGFDQALKQAVVHHGIGEIYTPNIVVWNHLSQSLATLLPGVRLANSSPVAEVLGSYRSAQTKARHWMANPLCLMSELPLRRMLSGIELAAMSRYADLVPGMCDDDKIHALLEIAGHSINGDIVEIGSWWGKSAFVLAQLARSFGIGNLLCVDPWTNEHLVQDEQTVDSASAQVDAHEALRVFQIGLLPVNQNHINYLRLPSVDGARHYASNRSASTEVFGHTDYTGQISILHIDGNHAYDAVRADVLAWEKFLVAGSWIILDDYIWPYGDGPRKIGDDYLRRNCDRITTAFVMGTALFMQLSPHI